MKHLVSMAALAAALACGTAQAQTTVKVGVMSDMSSLYSDIGGAGSVAAAKLAIADFQKNNPNVKVELEEFTDVIGRHFRQPEEGLGFDDSPSAHMWRTIMWPTRYL